MNGRFRTDLAFCTLITLSATACKVSLGDTSNDDSSSGTTSIEATGTTAAAEDDDDRADESGGIGTGASMTLTSVSETTPWDSGSDSGDTGTNPGLRVFVTSTLFDSFIGDPLSGADSACQLAADASELGGTWRAWLSNGSTNAVDHIEGNGPWFDLDSRKVFNNAANLRTAPLVPIEITERGEYIDDESSVWTGTAPGGLSSADHCEDWTSEECGGIGFIENTEPEVQGLVGSPTSTTATWTSSGAACCGSATARLYCFEQ